MQDLPFNLIRRESKQKPRWWLTSKTGYGYFWNGFDITEEVMNDLLPPFVREDVIEIKVRKRYVYSQCI